uniref:Uncharacterized protein n=1 Tax=Anopheles christyi TaxID=43041 RepID=A0A182KCU7_9DIPT
MSFGCTDSAFDIAESLKSSCSSLSRHGTSSTVVEISDTTGSNVSVFDKADRFKSSCSSLSRYETSSSSLLLTITHSVIVSLTTVSKVSVCEVDDSLKSSCSSLSRVSTIESSLTFTSSCLGTDTTDAKASVFEAAENLNSSCSSLSGVVGSTMSLITTISVEVSITTGSKASSFDLTESLKNSSSSAASTSSIGSEASAFDATEGFFSSMSRDGAISKGAVFDIAESLKSSRSSLYSCETSSTGLHQIQRQAFLKLLSLMLPKVSKALVLERKEAKPLPKESHIPTLLQWLSKTQSAVNLQFLLMIVFSATNGSIISSFDALESLKSSFSSSSENDTSSKGVSIAANSSVTFSDTVGFTSPACDASDSLKSSCSSLSGNGKFSSKSVGSKPSAFDVAEIQLVLKILPLKLPRVSKALALHCQDIELLQEEPQSLLPLPQHYPNELVLKLRPSLLLRASTVPAPQFLDKELLPI